MNKSICPNLSHPDAQSIINSVGLQRFNELYVENNYNIPDPKNVINGKLGTTTDLSSEAINGEISDDAEDSSIDGRSEMDLLFINREFFNKWQQDEIVDSLLFETQKHRKNGVSNVNQVRRNIYEDLQATLKWLRLPENESNPRAIDIASHIENVITHFDEFMQEVTKKILRQDVVIRNMNDELDSEQEEVFESSDNLYQKQNYSDEANFMQSSKDTASGDLKVALSLVPRYEYENGEVVLDKKGNPKHKRSIIGRPTYEPLDRVWNDLLYTLYNVPIGEKLNFLKNSPNPKHREIARIIESDPNESLKNAFESVFNKQQAKFITINFSRPNGLGEKTMTVFDTNRMNADNMLVSSWSDNFLDTKAIKTVDGIKFVDVEYGKQLQEEYKEVLELFKNKKDNEAYVAFRNLIRKIGIDVSLAALKSDARIDKTNPKRLIQQKFKHIFNRLAGGIDNDGVIYEEELEKNNPFLDDASGLETLARYENLVNPSLFEASFIGGDGKAKYSFVNNSYMSIQFNKLKTNKEYVRQLLSTDFASGSYVLNSLMNDPAFADVLSFTYIDTLGNDANNQANKAYKDMNNKEKEILRIALYQNSGIGTDKDSSNVGYFISLTPSDKTTTPVIRSKKIDIRTGYRQDQGYIMSTTSEGYRVLLDQFMSEYNRVKKTYQQIKNQEIYAAYSEFIKAEGNRDVEIDEFIYETDLESVKASKKVKNNIQNIRDGNSTFVFSGNPISGYHDELKAGTKFFIFDSFNGDKNLFEDGELKDLTSDEVKEIITPKLMKMFSDMVSNQIEYWKSLGIYPDLDNYIDFFDRSYAKKKGIPKRPRLIKERGETKEAYEARQQEADNSFKKDIHRHAVTFAGEYSLNQFIMMVSQMQMISGDPALHAKVVWQDVKKIDPNIPASVDLTWDNFFKRMAKDIAPGIDGVWKKPHYNTIFLKDLSYSVEDLAKYNELIGKVAGEAYARINPADAQEYTTLQEHLDVLEATGRLTEEIKEAGQRLIEEGSDIKDIKEVLQVMKPVYVNGIIENDINKMYYIKSSAFPLIPALVKGLNIEGLMNLMLENDIQRAAYESATKIGIQGELVNVSENSVDWTKPNINEHQIIKLNREGFRIQQEIPYSGDETHINEGSQGKKLIMNNIKDADVLEYNGKKYTGREFKEIFDNLHVELMDRAMDRALEDMGIDKNTLRFKDKSRIEKLLKEEAESRGFPISAIYSIQLVTHNGKPEFKIPISLTNNAMKYESILNSIITNRVIKNTLPGFSGIQVASSGFKAVTTVEQVKGNVGYASIIWTNPADTDLKYHINEDGSVYADIVVPNYIRKSFNNEIEALEDLIRKKTLRIEELGDTAPKTRGNYYKEIREHERQIREYRRRGSETIDLNDYILEDGTLDKDRLPDDILTVIGVRIPTQGYNSMMKFKVKGFLPKIMGDSIIVPPEVVAQMGSDFDVDKLYIYNYNHYVTKNGSVRKVKKALPDSASEIDYSSLKRPEIENLIIQFFEDRLSDPRITNQILEPNGFGDLPALVKEIRAIKTKGTKHHVVGTKHQNDVHDTNSSGKMGVAKFSLYSTFFRIAQDSNMSIRTPILTKNSEGEAVSLSSLSSIEAVNGNLKSNIIMYLQSASVDNAKEQLLAELNINNNTMDVAGVMALLGFSERYIGLFLRQDHAIRYSSMMDEANSITENNYKRMDDILNSLEVSFTFNENIGHPIEDIKKLIRRIPTTEDNLMNRLKGVDIGLDMSGLNDKERGMLSSMDEASILDYKLIADFIDLAKAGNTMRTLQSAINVDTKGIGSSFAYVQFKITQINNLLGNNLSPIKGIKNLYNNKIVEKSYEVLRTAYTAFGNLYSYGSPTYKTILETLRDNNVMLNEKGIRDIYNELKSFILSNPSLLDMTKEEKDALEKELLYSEKGNIARLWRDYSTSPAGQRNPLTRRIKPKFSSGGVSRTGSAIPNRVYAINTPASNDSADIDSNLAYLYDMFNSEDAKEREVAEKLVKYFVITGASYGPQSIGKYISFDILEKFGFSKKLRDINSFIHTTTAFSGFVKQFFQNNPFKAKVMDDIITPPNSISYEKNKAPRGENKLPLNYFTVYDKKNRVPVLYMLTNETSKNLIYNKIPIVGDSFTKRYDYTDTEGHYVVKPKEELPTIEGGLEKDTNKKELTDDISEKSTRDILEDLSKSKNAAIASMAKDLLESGSLDEVEVFTSSNHYAYGWFDGKNVYINLDVINSRNDPQARLEATLIEEFLHAATSAALSGKIDLNPAQQKAVNRINRLFEQYRSSADQDALGKFLLIYQKTRAGYKLTKEESTFYNNSLEEYYPLVNVNEFVGRGLASSEFREKLKSGNLWEKLVDFISDLLGIKKSDFEFLYDETLVLLNESKPSGREVGGTIDQSAAPEALKDASTEDDRATEKAKKENIQLKLINDYIRRLRASERRLKRKRRELGKDAPININEKIADIRDKISYLTANSKITSFIRLAEAKLEEIANSLDDIKDLTDVLDAKEYINVLVGLTRRLEFREEFDEWNKRVDAISSSAERLNKKFKPILVKKINDILKSRTSINYSVDTNINRGLKEVSYFDANYLDGSMSSSEDLQAIKYLIESYVKEANDAQDSFNEEYLEIVRAYTDAYGNDYSQFLEKDISGKPTGRLITKYTSEYYNKKPTRKNSVAKITRSSLNKYEEERKNAFETMNAEDYKKWVSYNDPKAFVEVFNSTNKVSRYNRFVVIEAKPEYRNPEYDKLMSKGESDPAVVFYNFITPILERNNKFHNQRTDYIPEMSASVMELLVNGQFRQTANLLESKYHKLLEEEVVGDPNDIDIVTGKPRLYIPSQMFKGVLKPEEKSYDLAKLIEAVVYQENTLRAKYKAEPVLNLYYSLLNEANSFLRENEDGSSQTYEKSPSRLLDQASFMIDFYLYNKTRSDSESEKKYGKAVDTLISYTRLLGMGWNPFSAIGNITQGITSNFTIAGRETYFNRKEALKAFNLAFNTMSFGATEEAKKISVLMKKFDVFVMQNELNFGKSKDLETATKTGLARALDPYDWQARGEYYVQSITMIGVLLNQKIKLDNGEEVSVYDGFDSNGKWKPEYGENPFDNRSKEGSNRVFKMQQTIRAALSDVHGNYNSPIMVKQDFAGRALMVFRTWLPQHIHQRFGSERTNILTGKTTKGRYRSYKSFFTNEDGEFDLEAAKDNLAWALMMSNTSTMSEIDMANMRANLTELGMIVGITLAMAIFRSMMPDDDEDSNFTYYMYALNTLVRTYGDLTFFLNYNSFNSITQSLIPVATPIYKILDILPATWNYILGDDTYSTGPRYGQSKLVKALTDPVPLVSQIDKNIVYTRRLLGE